MKVLITVKENPPQSYLVYLLTNKLRDEVKRLVSNRKYTEALAVAFSKGEIERKVRASELPRVEADLILTEKNARWDLT